MERFAKNENDQIDIKDFFRRNLAFLKEMYINL